MHFVVQKMILEQTKKIKETPIVGSIIEGKVVARDRSSLFVDLGIQGTGIIYGREFYEAKSVIKSLNMGDTVVAKILEVENEDGYRELSLRDATKDLGWKKIKELKEKGEIINVKIAGVNKGGLLTNIDNIPAFLPVSQLSPENYPRVADADKQKILKELQKFVGKTLEVKVLDLSPEENKLILSEKAKTAQATKAILENYKKGDVVEGRITGIANFGVFIRFPLTDDNPPPEKSQEAVVSSSGENEQSVNNNSIKETAEGLIHISELDWQMVENPAEVVKVGEIVKAQIINISNNQVFLSLKSLKENPWEEIEKECKKGDIVKGKVISFSSFGAFIEVSSKIRALCHISEFGSQEKIQENLKIGEVYDFEILAIEPKEHRMSLKLVVAK